jgi:hypothetical protein
MGTKVTVSNIFLSGHFRAKMPGQPFPMLVLHGARHPLKRTSTPMAIEAPTRHVAFRSIGWDRTGGGDGRYRPGRDLSRST